MKIKRRTLHRVQVWAIRTAVVATLSLLWYLYAYTQIFSITSYVLEGVRDDAKAPLQSRLYEIANTPRFGFLPNNKIFSYSSSAIVGVVRNAVPDAATISVRPVGLHEVKIIVTLLMPVLRTDDGLGMTENGILFSPVKSIDEYPSITVASATKQVVKIDGLPFEHFVSGDDEVNASFLQDILAMSTKVSSIIFPVTHILVEDNGDVTLSNASGTSKVMFLRTTDQRKVWTTLVSAIDTEPLKEKLEKNRKGLLYLDVRYGNKVFYRFDDMLFQDGKRTVILGDHATTTESTTTAPR
jgi:hypothetical protein